MFFDCETTSTGNDGTAVDVVLAITRVDNKSTVWREMPAAPLTRATAVKLASCLVNHVGTVCTFNGAGFDFKIIAALICPGTLRTQLIAKCIHSHVDIFFDFFTSVGYFASMESFCVACNLDGKSWSGAESAAAAITAFSAGCEDRELIMEQIKEYCIGDTVCLEQLCAYLDANCCLRRVAKSSGKITSWTPWKIKSFRTVADCLRDWTVQPVDTSWMSPPPPSPSSLLAWVVKEP